MKSLPRLATISVGLVIAWCFGYLIGYERLNSHRSDRKQLERVPVQNDGKAMLLDTVSNVMAATPLQLTPSTSVPLSDPNTFLPPVKVRLDLPIGPTRIDYGLPIKSEAFSETAPRNHTLDAPGPGYRDQRARFLK